MAASQRKGIKDTKITRQHFKKLSGNKHYDELRDKPLDCLKNIVNAAKQRLAEIDNNPDQDLDEKSVGQNAALEITLNEIEGQFFSQDEKGPVPQSKEGIRKELYRLAGCLDKDTLAIYSLCPADCKKAQEAKPYDVHSSLVHQLIDEQYDEALQKFTEKFQNGSDAFHYLERIKLKLAGVKNLPLHTTKYYTRVLNKAAECLSNPGEFQENFDQLKQLSQYEKNHIFMDSKQRTGFRIGLVSAIALAVVIFTYGTAAPFMLAGFGIATVSGFGFFGDERWNKRPSTQICNLVETSGTRPRAQS